MGEVVWEGAGMISHSVVHRSSAQVVMCSCSLHHHSAASTGTKYSTISTYPHTHNAKQGALTHSSYIRTTTAFATLSSTHQHFILLWKNIIFSLPSFFTFMVYKKEEIKSEIDLKDSNKLQFPFTLHILHARHILECHTLKHIRIKSVGKDRSFG